jgi:hypothetical protein
VRMDVMARCREDRRAVPKPPCPVFILVKTQCAGVKLIIVLSVFDMEFVGIYANDRPCESKVTNTAMRN